MKTSILSLLALCATTSTSALSTPTPVTPNPAIKAMATGMSLLKPVFSLEAQLQAAILGKLGGIDTLNVEADIAAMKKENKVLIYTYGLSPFSVEAVNMLEQSGYEFTKKELGLEWFLLGPKESVARVVLSKDVEGGATSLPKIFIGGECIGGCKELADLVERGELDTKMKQAKVGKKGAGKTAFSLWKK